MGRVGYINIIPARNIVQYGFSGNGNAYTGMWKWKWKYEKREREAAFKFLNINPYNVNTIENVYLPET